MKKQLLGFLLIISFIFSVSAQTSVDSTESERNLRTHVLYLASDALEGRRTGEQGATTAAGYVANMFANYKLKAGVSQTVNGRQTANFLQSFPYFSGVELGKDNFLRIVPGGAGEKETKMEIGENWMPVGFSVNGYIPPAPVVFAGYGISAKDANYDDYANLDAKEKIVLVFAGTPDAGNPHSPFARFNLYAKAKIAQEKGAKALLVIASENDFKREKLAELKYEQTSGETAIPAAVISRSAAANALGAADEAALAQIEDALAKRKDAPKPTANLKFVAQLKVDLTKKQTAEAYNVIGILEGRDAALKNEAIVIGAHYDHLGRGGQGSLAVNSTEIHHGADDNASGVAAMLELARQFSEAKNNKRTLIFIAFGGEEEGLIGSKFYVNNPVFPLAKTVAMINLDMVGRLNENKLNVGGIGTASELKSLINGKNQFEFSPSTLVQPGTLKEVSSAKIGISRFQLSLNEDGFGPSDHSSFYAQKIPVLFFFTGTHADYHKPSDTAEKINYQGLLKITNFVGEIVKAVDQNPKKPSYTVAKSSAPMGGRRGFNVSLGTVPSYGDSSDGLLLDGVRENSPAAKAGLKAGDKIVKLAGRDVKNVQDYTFILGDMKAGEEYEIIIMRGAEKLTLKIVPAPSAR
jgi:hypothetical protein